jgi:hypothetical protein
MSLTDWYTRTPPAWLVALGLILAYDALVPALACAQATVRVTPSFSTILVHESNLFSTPSDRQADLITRVTPSIESAYASTVWTLIGRYSHDVERFADHPELTTTDARRHATVGLEYRPTRRWSVAADGEFSKTHTPGELNTLTNLAFSRAPAERIVAHSLITRQLHRATAGRIDYRFTEDRLAGVKIRTHDASVGADHHVSSRDTLKVESRVQQFVFESSGAGSAPATSLALIAGWTRAIGRDTDLVVDAGPRAVNGTIAPELSAGVRIHGESGSLSIAYSRTQATIIGLTGTADTQSLAATAGWRVRRWSQITVSPALVRSQHGAMRADVYRLMLDASHRIGKNFSVALSGIDNIQNGNFYASLAGGTIRQQTIMIKLIAEPDFRRPDHARR